jgi:hypothetical protein
VTADDVCGRLHPLGPVCAETTGHEGPHRAHHGYRWTDQSAARGADLIARQLQRETRP